MTKAILRYGIPGLIKMIIAACRKKHEYYAPTMSIFSVWADVLERHLVVMQKEVADEFIR